MGTSWVVRRRTGIGFTVAALLVTGLLTIGAGGRVQAQEQLLAPPNIEFSQSSFTLPTDGEANLRLFNNTTFELVLTLRIGPNETFDVTAPESIPPGASVAVTVSATDVDEGVEGTLVAVATPRGNDRLVAAQVGGVARAGFTVGEPQEDADAAAAAEEADAAEEDEAVPPPAPLVSEWSVTSYRFKPWGDSTENGVLPLRDARSCRDVELPGGTLGGVSATPGAARVLVSCTDEGAPGADIGASLSFPGLAHNTGDYTGAIDLAPDGDDGAGVVGLTVRRTDYFVLPLVVLLLGVAVAIVAVRRVVRLGARAAEEREAWLLLARVDEADRTFRAKARDAGWSAYSFKPDADRRVRAALGELARPVPAASQPKAVVTSSVNGADEAGGRVRLEPIATAAASWPLLAERLAELEVAVSEVALKAPSHRPPRDGSIEPTCLAAARPLLVGRRLDVDEAVECASAVDGAATLVQGWLGWASLVSELESRVELLALTVDDLPEDHPDRVQLANARAKLSDARVGLWEADTLATLEERGTLAAIGEARALVEGLSHRLRDDASTGNGAGPMVERAELTVPAPARSPLRSVLESRAASLAEVTQGMVRRRRWRTGIAMVVTATVVVASGLSVLYAGQAFGSPRDYLAVFVWGLGGQAVLAALAAGFDRLVSGGAEPAGA